MNVNKTIQWLKNLAKPGESLSQRVVHAGFWAFLLRIVNRLFSVARIVVLAHLLSPKDFGLFGIAQLALSALESFSETGFEAALIQKKGDVKPYLNAAWTIQVCRGLILAGILAICAPLIAGFFKEPHAVDLLRLLALAQLVKGMANIGVVFFQKELEFHRQFTYMFSGTLADFAVTIIAALILRNAWALAYGLLAGNIVRMFMSYAVVRQWPKPSFDLLKLKELFVFGKWLLGRSPLIYLGGYLDNIVVGRMLGATSLGLYQMSYQISNLPATEISYVADQVTLPAYAKLQDQTSNLAKAYLTALSSLLLFATPLTVVLVYLAPELVTVLLGSVWIPAVPALRILAIGGWLKSLTSSASSLFIGSGRPRLDFFKQLLRVVTLAALVYPLTKFLGVQGTALAVVLSVVAMLLLWYPWARRITEASGRDFARPLVLPLAGAALMTGAMVIAKILLAPSGRPPTQATLIVAAIAVIGVLTYVGAVLFMQNRWPRFKVVGLLEPFSKFMGGG